MTIVEFLLARIAEDEAVHPKWGWPENVEHHESGCMELAAVERADAKCDCKGPSRWLAECQAKRALIDEALRVGAQVDGVMGCCHEADELRQVPAPDRLFPGGCPGADTVRDLLVPLAAVYADHPDYDTTWRVT